MSFLSKVFSRRSSPQGTIALLTDFGREDHYVAVMKGVIATINREARVIDLSHDVGAQSIRQGAYLLWAGYRFFPARSIFVAVVDPGVGTSRSILAVRVRQGKIFVAPANGLLDLVLHDEPVEQAVEVRVEGSRYVLPEVSATFHGRDVFAPVAAYLSAGLALESLGRPLNPAAPVNPFVSRPEDKKGEVLHVDRFGNMITNVRVPYARRLIKAIAVRKMVIKDWIETYEDAPARQPCLIVGSSGLVEVVVNKGNAAQQLRGSVGSPVKVYWK